MSPSSHCRTASSSSTITDLTSAEPLFSPAHNENSFPSASRRQDSFSTISSNSTISSPTKTASLADASPTYTETPTTSPDTPTKSLSHHSSSPRPVTGGKLDLRAPKPNALGRSSPPVNRARNLKNLAVDTSGAMPFARAISTASFPQPTVLASPIPESPLSPPLPSSTIQGTRKSRHLGLTLMTSGVATPGLSVPPTPSVLRPSALRHFQRSPSMPVLSIRSPKSAEAQLPSTPFSPLAGAFPDAPFEQDLEQSESFDVPLSREEQLAAYPDGPICIYEPYIDLYLEPTAEQASGYDVIFNVASEVMNPFSSADLIANFGNPTTSISDVPVLSNPQHHLVGKPFIAQPEYIHVPWEHNTDIVPDLYHLVKVLDARVQKGKRILIHCQCGVSRSASLVVAYGLYKNPSINVQEAYDAVKRRSKWISPNMNLIMQLQEFRSSLLKMATTLNPQKPVSRISYSQQGCDSSAQRAPQSAPLMPEVTRTVPAPIRIDGAGEISHGPASAPSHFHGNLDYEEPRFDLPTSLTSTAASKAPNAGLTDPMHQGCGNASNVLATHLSQDLARAASISTSSDQHTATTTNVDWTMTTHKPIELHSKKPPVSVVLPPFGNHSPEVMSPRTTAFQNPFDQLASWPKENITESTHRSHGRNASQESSSRPLEIGKSSEIRSSGPCQLGISSITRSSPPNSFFADLAHRSRTERSLKDDQLHSAMAMPHADPQFRTTRGSRSEPATGCDSGVAAVDPEAESPKQLQFRTSSHSEGSGLPHSPPMKAGPEVTDALLSPLPSEFPGDPFHSAILATPPRMPSGFKAVDADGDPRSPPQKGSSPIICNIFDVF